MSLRSLGALALLPLLSGCFTPMVAEAIADAGEPPVRRVKIQVKELQKVVRSRDGRYYVVAAYNDGSQRSFVYETFRREGLWPEATSRPLDMEAYPESHAFPKVSTPIPIWTTSNQPADSCARLLANHLQLRQGNVEFVSVARFPAYTNKIVGERSWISYFHQVCLGVIAMPFAVAGDIATCGLLFFVNYKGPFPVIK